MPALIGLLTGYVTVAHTFIGSPPGTDFRNPFGWSVGAAYALIPTSPSLRFSAARRLSRAVKTILSSFAWGELKIIKGLKLTGGPDQGVERLTPTGAFLQD